ncbi:MAG: DNA-3-methyladenine glycosylase [Chthoniobacterales bacterium]
MDARIALASFFKQDPLRCARGLVGAELIWGKCVGVIVETEAYSSVDDEACHTFVRPSTRAFIERNKPGTAYIYLHYGMHWMLNVLVKGEGSGFVLIRALEPIRGIRTMQARRGIHDIRQLCSGPGKLTQALQITDRHHEMDLCSDPLHCFRLPNRDLSDVVADERIGITKSAAYPWRFTLRESRFVSRAVKLQTG